MGKLYRYKSITSELKVWAERSPLSEWTDTTIVKKLRFQILFNQADFQAISKLIPKVIRGNQNHLESLIAGVVGYVDNLSISESSSQIFSRDSELKLFHQLFIPNFPEFNQLEFSTLELFDLVTNIELLRNDIQILPTDIALNPVLNLQLKLVNPLWWRLVAVAIATVGITRFLSPQSPEYSPQSIATSNLAESASEQKPNQKPESKLPNNPKISQPKTAIPLSPRATQKEQVKPDGGRIAPTNPQNPVNITSSPQLKKTEPKPPGKSIPKSAPKTERPNNSLTLSDPKILKSSPNLSRTKSPIPSLKTPDRLVQKPQVVPAPINPSTTSESSQIPLGLNDSNRTTAIPSPERQKARAGSEINPSTSSQIFGDFRGDSDRLSNPTNLTLTDRNAKITVIKIDGSPNSQELQIYRQKILTWQAQRLAGEINLEVQWQNREITELKIQPENPELTEFIRRSLFDTFSDQDGNIQISLKVTP